MHALGQGLHDREPFVRWAAAQSLGEVVRGARSAALRTAAGKVVLQAAGAQEPGVRAAGADAIASWGRGAPLEPALVLIRDDEPPVRAAAVRALGLAGSSAPQVVVPALLRALGDADPEVRRMAADALAWCRDESSALQLRARLGDRAAVVRAAAVRALARLGGDYEAAIVPLLQDSDPAVRVEAVRFLRQRGSVRCRPALESMAGDVTPAGETTIGEMADEASRYIARHRGPWPQRWLRR